jgi:hypothetical protein
MDKVTSTLSSAASKVTKGASSTAEYAAKGVSSTASKVTKGASSTAHTVAKGASSTASKMTEGLSTGASAVSKLVTSATSSKRNDPAVLLVSEGSGVISGLMEHRISASVSDLDHFRKNNLLVVETDYIIKVTCTAKGDSKKIESSFLISKTYSSFRTLVSQLCKLAEEVMKDGDPPKKVTKLATYCDASRRIIESQSTEYLGKVNFSHVQTLAKERSQIINEFLDATITNFPDEQTMDNYPFARQVGVTLERFFLNDHCEEASGDSGEDSHVFGTLISNPLPKKFAPQSRKRRQSVVERGQEKEELLKASSLRVAEEEEQTAATTSKEKPSPLASAMAFLDGQPLVAVALFAGAMQVERALPLPSVNFGSLLTSCFACFCLGLHAQRLLGLEPKPQDTSIEKQMMQKTMVGAEVSESQRKAEPIESPMKRFPEGAKLGSIMNAWSDPPPTVFMVRGENYLTDKKKIQSGPFLFPNRGIDLFLTDQCPENVGR